VGSAFFTEAEQADFKLAEEIMLISEHGLPDATYEKAVFIFSQQKLAQLILAIIGINRCNRTAVSTHVVVDQGDHGSGQ
jgi:alkylhydroperoxidase family enzyme